MAVLVVVLVAGFVYTFRLGSMPLLEPDEARYGEVAREMLESGDWITPRVNYVRYLAKPPLMFWLMALSFSALEPSEFSARLPCALTAIVGLLVCLAFGRAAFGPRAGLLASLVLATSGLYFAMGLVLRFDMPLTVLIMLALFLWWRARWEQHRARQTAFYLLSYAAAGLATLTKGPIGALLPGLIIVVYLAWLGKLRELLDPRHLLGLAVFLAVAGPWYALAELRNPGYLSYFLLQENLARYGSAHYGFDPFYYFVPVLIIAFFPWTAFLPLGLVQGWRLLSGGGDRSDTSGRRRREKQSWLHALGASLRGARQRPSREGDAAALCLTWFTVTFVLFSASRGEKLPVYILPAWPALALLVGKVLADATRERRAALSRALRWSIAAFLGVLAVVSGGALYYVRTHVEIASATVANYEAAVVVAGALGILLIGVALLRRMRATAVVLMAAATAGLLLSLTGLMVPIAYAKSPKRLVRRIQPVTRPSDTVLCYLRFVHAAPFYLRREAIHVGKQPPPDFVFDPGEAKEDGLWLDDEGAIGDLLSGDSRVFLFTGQRKEQELIQTYGDALHLLGRTEEGTVLFANRAGAEALAAHEAASPPGE